MSIEDACLRDIKKGDTNEAHRIRREKYDSLYCFSSMQSLRRLYGGMDLGK